MSGVHSPRTHSRLGQKLPNTTELRQDSDAPALGAPRVSGGGIQVLMPQDLRQTHQVIPIVQEELMRHCVPEQVWVQLYADQR